MTWTYSESETTDRDRIRGKIGDTNTNRQLLADETIDSVLVDYPTVITAAIECCRRIIAKKAGDVDRSAIGMSSSRSQVVTHYQDLIEQLQQELGTQAEMYAGGASIADADTFRANTDYPTPPVTIGGMDFTG